MTFMPGGIRLTNRIKRTRDFYGDNAKLMLRSVKVHEKNTKPSIHSFPHLLEKNFPVRKIDWKYVDSAYKPIRSFAITEKDRQKAIERRASK